MSSDFATGLASVRDLAARFPAAHLRRVTCVRAEDLDRLADPSGATRVWLALESLQVTGSFKVRGALVALDALQRAARTNGQGRARVVAASAGNHGAGVAYAAKVLGCDATVVVPANAPLAKRSKIQAYGCTIVVSASPHYDDAEAEAIALAASTGAHFVSPYDDVDVLTGNGASLGFEIARAIGRVPDRALVPFGGGGLASGMAAAFAHEANESLASARRVWGVQSDISPAMAMSLARGEAVTRLECERSLADGLEGGISERAFARAKDAIGGVVVVPESAIARAMGHAYDALGLVLEGSAAIAIAPFFTDADARESRYESASGDLVCVLTGRNVDRERFADALRSAPARTSATSGPA